MKESRWFGLIFEDVGGGWELSARYPAIFCQNSHPWYIFGDDFKMTCQNLKNLVIT